MRDGERGFALVAVLVAVAVAAALAAAALSLARASLAGATGYAAEIEGGHAATAAIRLAAIRLADPAGYGVRDAETDGLTSNGWQVSIRIEDEATKIDLNRAPRNVTAAALVALGVDPAIASAALRPPDRRFVAIDELAAALRLPAESLPLLRRRFTVFGGDDPQQTGIRSALETYCIIAEAPRGDRRIVRWETVRLSPGFGDPFEWLERGRAAVVTPSSSSLPRS